MAFLTLPYIPLAIWQFPLLLDGYHTGHPFYPLREEFFLLLQLYSSGLIRFSPADLFLLTTLQPDQLSQIVQHGITFLHSPTVSLIPNIIFVFLFLCGLFLKPKHTKEPKLTRRLVLAAWALLPPLIVYFISLRVHIFEDRYLIYISTAFYLLVVVGLALVWQYSRWLAALCLSLVLIFNFTGLWQQQRRPIKADFRAAAEYLANQPQLPSTIMLHLSYLQYTFNYYYPHGYTMLDGLWTNGGKSESAVDSEMTALTADLSDLWLVVSEDSLWDDRQLTQAWLNRHADVLDEAHFMRVDVYHYQLRPGLIETQSKGISDH
jgi:hypothetical protein